MINFNKMLNVGGNNIEEKIKEAIKQTREDFINVDEKKMCLYYSNHLSDILKEDHIMHRIINTKEGLKYGFRHGFIISPSDLDNSYYLIDLTYSQFPNHSIPELLEKGYVLLNKDTDKDKWTSYLKDVSGSVAEKHPNIEETFMKIN